MLIDVSKSLSESPITVAATYGDLKYFGRAIVYDDGRIFMLSTGPELDKQGGLLPDYYAIEPKDICDVRITLESDHRIILWLTLRGPLGIEFLD